MNSIWTFLLLCSVLTPIETFVRLTNLKCDEFDPEFATFPICILKVVRRGVISMNIHVKLLQLPVNNVTLNLSLHKKASGYRPFLYNKTVDFCQFHKNRNKYPFVKVFYEMVSKYSNFNHTCPYDHDIIMDNLVLQESSFKYIPLPRGEYMFQMKVGAYNDWKANVEMYISISRDL